MNPFILWLPALRSINPVPYLFTSILKYPDTPRELPQTKHTTAVTQKLKWQEQFLPA